MEELIQKIKVLQKKLDNLERNKNYYLSYGQKNYIEEKVKNGKNISFEELKNYARRYKIDTEIEEVAEELEKLKDEFIEKKEEFFEFLKIF